MSSCNHDCSNCNENCNERDFTIKLNDKSEFKKKIGIVSGKGGVGKSLVSALLACSSSKLGYSCAILDGDILGPSIPKILGVTSRATGDKDGTSIIPANGPLNIDVISSSMLLENETDPIIWRGSIVSSIIKQFYSDVIYGKKDVLYIDMPPGTGDVPLTVFQSIPLDGIIIVTSPQDLVSMIVTKAINMANMMNIPILGIVENYSYITCPDCDKNIELFGKSNIEEIAALNNIPFSIKLPLNPTIASLCDAGKISEFETHEFDDLINYILK